MFISVIILFHLHIFYCYLFISVFRFIKSFTMNGEQHMGIDNGATIAAALLAAQTTADAGIGVGSQAAGMLDGPQQVSNPESVQMQALRVQQEKLQVQCDAIKSMAREAEKKAEIAKHKSPQIKRSMDFLLDAKFEVSDAKELIEKAISHDGDIYSILCSLAEKMNTISDKVDSEILANRIASKATYGWKTVKCFETDSLFQGEDAEALTKKFKQAEFQASKDSFRGRRGGRGGYSRGHAHHPYQNSRNDSRDFRFPASGRSAYGQPSFAPPSATITSGATGGKACYGCGNEGHQIKFCPMKK